MSTRYFFILFPGISKQDGCFAEYVVAPVENLVAVPSHVTDTHAVFAEPLAAALEILEQKSIDKSDKVLIIGDGKLGLLIALSLMSVVGGDLTILGRHMSKMNIVKAQFPTVKTLLSDTFDMAESYDIVIECTGNDEGFSTAINVLRCV